MAKTIAVAGKGGVGKTTICGMIVEYLIKKVVSSGRFDSQANTVYKGVVKRS